ncbi:hypothetical protein [Glutamicibacter arilaitensis]|nr:hypothetical protein [Glutamicibacter arilaitensis]
MREKLDEPMHISEVMAEYLQELETTCNNHQAVVNDSGSLYAQGEA